MSVSASKSMLLQSCLRVAGICVINVVFRLCHGGKYVAGCVGGNCNCEYVQIPLTRLTHTLSSRHSSFGSRAIL